MLVPLPKSPAVSFQGGRMIETQSVNYLAVLVAGVAYMMLGSVWYSPILFGKAWMRGVGKTQEQVAADFKPINYVWAFICSLIICYGIARFMVWSGGDSIKDGVMVGLLAGISFVLATFWVNDTFETRNRGLTIINVLYHLVGLIIAGIIIGWW
jgi:hypothetical protein